MRRVGWCLLLIIPTAFAIQCNVCGDANLDEFGECEAQFPYDCDAYARRFSPDEKIYCRTTRHKATNGTYTILKECISESDHYKKFPEKEYPLDEECDLVEIDGQEVAYCLCRSGSLCNEKPIAEQFSLFEAKHPELFATDESPELSEVRSAPPRADAKVFRAGGDNAATFGAAARNQQLPIQPVNDLRFVKNSRDKLPSRETGTPEMKDMESAEIDALFRAREAARASPTLRETNSIGRIDAVMPAPPRSSGFVFSTNALDGSMIAPKTEELPGIQPVATFQAKPRAPPLPSPVLAVAPPSTLKCAQCGQGMLADESTDCTSQQTVDCVGTDTLCFTRQILLGTGQNAIEKMCVNSAVLENEYGESVVKDGCGEAHQGKVRYCVCNKNECNKESIIKQLEAQNPESIPARPAVNEEIVPKVPVPLVPIQPVNQPLPATEAPRTVQKALVPPQQPIVELKPPVERPAPIKPNVVAVAKNLVTASAEASLHCMMCTEAENTDPIADCTSSVPVACAGGRGDEEQTFCVTKQTQLATGLFSLEKKCTSREEFSIEFPDKKMESGCGVAFDGLINYCICTGDNCNRKSLLEQTQLYRGDSEDNENEQVDDGEELTQVKPEKKMPARQEFGGFNRVGPVPDSVDIRSELDRLKEKEQKSVDITALPADDLETRQRQWAQREAELARSASIVSLLTPLFFALLARLL
ncbi:unnamed protein product, partial [Mesorhabditis spiculigera]